MSKTGCFALILGAAAVAAAKPAVLGPGQPFFIAGAPVGVAFGHAGEQLVAFADGRLRAWDVATAQPRLDLTVAGSGSVLAVVDDRIALVANGAVELRHAGDGTLERRLADGEAPVQLAFADATTLAEADRAGGISLVDVSSGARRMLAAPAGGLSCFAAGGGVVVGCRGGRMQRWNARTGEALAPLPIGEAERAALGGQAIAVATGGSLRILAAADGHVEHTLRFRDAPSALALSADGKRLAAARGDGVDVYDVASGRQLFDDRPRGGIRQVAFSADGARLFARGDDDSVRGWRVRDGSAVPASAADLPAPPSCPAPHAPPWQMAADCRAGILVDVATGRTRIWRAGARETSVTLPPRSGVLAQLGEHGLALATLPLEPPFDAKSGRALRRSTLLWLDDRGGVRLRRTLDGGVGALALTADGRRAALALDDDVLVFAAAGGAPERSSQPAPVRALAFGRDGATIAAGLADGTVTSWPLR